MDEDTTQAAWDQLEQEQSWERELEKHWEIDREFREWLVTEGFLRRRTEMALVKDMIQSKFLRKEDFDEDQVCTIKGCKMENVGKEDDAEQRWVLYFREREKGMVLNITTIRVLEAAYGGDTDHWVGNKAMVYVDPNVSFGGKVVGGLRLRTPKKQAVSAPIPPPAEFEEPNDSIPF